MPEETGLPPHLLDLELTGFGADGKRSVAQDEAVVCAIISMAHALELEVVAEGVGIIAQRKTLQRLGCDSVQEFLFSPPVSPERLESLLPPDLMPAEEKIREVQAA